MELWVANDMPEQFAGCLLRWCIESKAVKLMEGEAALDARPLDATLAATIGLPASLPDTITVSLELTDGKGRALARHRRETYLEAWRIPPPAVHRRVPPMCRGCRMRPEIPR